MEALRVIKRLLDAGHRTGRIVPLALDALQSLTEQTVDQPLRTQVGLTRTHDARGCAVNSDGCWHARGRHVLPM